MITEGLRTYLLADSSITDEIGTRIYAVDLPQEVTLPAVTFFLVSEVEQITHSQLESAQRSIVRFHVFASSYADVKTVSKLIRDRLKNVSDSMGSYTAQRVQYLGQRDTGTDPGLEMKERILEFRVWFTE